MAKRVLLSGETSIVNKLNMQNWFIDVEFCDKTTFIQALNNGFDFTGFKERNKYSNVLVKEHDSEKIFEDWDSNKELKN